MTRHALWISAPLVLAVACGQQPTAEEYDDVATGISALVADNPGSETTAVQDGITGAKGDLPSGLTRSGMGHLEGRRGTLDYSFDLTCKDASDVTLAPCDENTDSARLVIDIQGEVDTARYDATLARAGDWTLSNLMSDTATLDGQGSFDVESEFMAIFRNETRTFVLDYDAVYEGVKIRMTDHALMDGRITYTVHAKQTKSRTFRDIEREIDVEANVTFDGTGRAMVELDGTRRYEVNLKSGDVALQE